MNAFLPWAIASAILAMVLYLVTVVIIAHRKYAQAVAHLREHGIDSTALVVDAQQANIRVNRRRAWVLILAWRHPDTGREHRLESDPVWRENGLDDVRLELKTIGWLPVRLDPAAPERFHWVDVSALKQSR